MKRGLLISCAVALVASAAAASTLEGSFDRTFDVRPGSRVTLKNTNGHIVVRGWDQPRVQIHAHKRVESRDAKLARETFDALKIEPTPSSNGLDIDTVYPRREQGFFDWIAGTNVNMSVDYELTVPRMTDLRVDNTNGSIDISNVRGSTRVVNTNGHIELLQGAGDIDAETTNGGIRAELLEITGKPIRLETTNGRISVALPRSLAANVDAATTNGSIKTDLPITTTEISRNSLRGTINGGGSELHLRTTNGSISIESK